MSGWRWQLLWAVVLGPAWSIHRAGLLPGGAFDLWCKAWAPAVRWATSR